MLPGRFNLRHHTSYRSAQQSANLAFQNAHFDYLPNGNDLHYLPHGTGAHADEPYFEAIGVPEARNTKPESSKERIRANAKKSRMRSKQHEHDLMEKVADLTEKCRVRTLERENEEMKLRHEKERRDENRMLVQQVLDHRASGCLCQRTWERLLTVDYVMRIPVTVYRSFDPLEVQDNHRVVYGVAGMIRDVASLAQLALAINSRRKDMVPAKITMKLDPTAEVQVDAVFYSQWIIEITTHTPPGCNFSIRGFVKAHITENRQVERLSLHFDNLAILKMLQTLPTFEIIPNTFDLVLKENAFNKAHASNRAQVIASTSFPYAILRVNEFWLQLFGYRMEEMENITLDSTDGPLTEKNKLYSLIESGKSFMPCSAAVVKYKKDGQPLWCMMQIVPLRDQYSRPRWCGLPTRCTETTHCVFIFEVIDT